jgi:hypothetical protein
MNDRLHSALDGDLDREDLTPAESAELDESTALFAGVLRSIPCDPLPDMGQAVARKIDAMNQSARPSPRRNSGVASWLWSSRTVAVRPAYVLAAAAVFAIAFAVRTTSNGTQVEPVKVAVTSAPTEVLVHFRLEAPDARSVALAGDFSNWAPAHTMTRSGSGVWTVVVPLTPGVHDYSFIVDGEKWVPDPAAPAKADGFGGMNSRIAVLTPDSRRSL